MKFIKKTITYQMSASDLVTLPEGTSLDTRWTIRSIATVDDEYNQAVYFKKGSKVLVTLEADK